MMFGPTLSWDCTVAVFFPSKVPLRILSNLDFVKSSINVEEGKIVFTGHSLGAAEAQFIADALQKNSVGFDSPGCSNIILAYRKRHQRLKSASTHIHYDHRANFVNAFATLFTGGSEGTSIALDHPLTTKFQDVAFILLLMFSAFAYFSVPDMDSSLLLHLRRLSAHFVMIIWVIYLGVSHTLVHHSIPTDVQVQRYVQRLELPIFLCLWVATFVGHTVVMAVRVWRFGSLLNLSLNAFHNGFQLTATIFLLLYLFLETWRGVSIRIRT